MKIISLILIAASTALAQIHWAGPAQSHGPMTLAGTNPGVGAPSAAENAYCAAGDVPSFGASDGPAALPTACVYTDTTGTPASGTTTTLACGGDLQAALNNATCGQKLAIPATCSGAQNLISGSFTLPNKSCDSSHWIWIESDQTGAAAFPAEHTRATPCAINVSVMTGYPAYPCTAPAVLMPKIQCNGSGNPACFLAAAAANHYRFVGLEIAQSATVNNYGSGIVDLSPGADHIIFDRILFHGQAMNCTRSGSTYTCTSLDTKNGIQLSNASYVAVINSWGYDFLCPQGGCTDAHAIGGGNGTLLQDGPFKFYNNLFAAAGESFIFGGSGSTTATVFTPVNTEIRANHLFKPVQWQLCVGCNGQHPENKNLGEFKNAQRVLMEGNVFENSWTGWQTDQSGFAMLASPKNQGNSIQTNSNIVGTKVTAVSGAPFASDMVGRNFNIRTTTRSDYGANYIIASVDASNTFLNLASTTSGGDGASLVAACHPGLNPTAFVGDLTVRYNETLNTTKGMEFTTATSDFCNDLSLGATRISVHDNLFEGVNSYNANSISEESHAPCLHASNFQPNGKNINTYTLEHNTCVIAAAGKFSSSGLDVTLDGTNTSSDGSTGTYFSNRIVRNNIGPAGGVLNYKSGILFPGGAASGLNQQSCTPAVATGQSVPNGTVCSWIYTRNLLGVGQWQNQTYNTIFPSTNLTCNAAGDTCFPSGSAFTAVFVNYNGPAGQPGYLGDYHLAPNGLYAGSGTDGKDIGANIDQILSLISGVRSATAYTPASVTTATLPNATVGTAYSQQLAGTSASDSQIWTVQSGTLPAGITLSLAGIISGTATTAGTSTFTVQMMDAAQQYATRALSLIVQ